MEDVTEFGGLVRLGEPRPLALEAIARVVERAGLSLPAPIAFLLSSWGPGLLCGVLTLEDPTDDSEGSRFRCLQRILRGEAAQARATGYWAQIPEDVFAHSMVLGVDLRGAALVLLPERIEPRLVLLHPRGYVLPIGDFEALRTFLLGTSLDRSRSAILHDQAKGNWFWASRSATPQLAAAAADLGVPATYRVAAGDARPRSDLAHACEPILAALRRGDEPAADEALRIALGENVALYVLLELLATLVDAPGGDVADDLRASYTDQVVRMVKRRAPCLVEEVPLSAVVDAVAESKTSRDLARVLRENSVLEPFAGVFSAKGDATTRAPAPAVALVEPLADAAARGFVAPPDFPPVSAEAQIAAHAEAWRRDDPHTGIGSLLDRMRPLHPGVRQGIALLIARLEGSSSCTGEPPGTVRTHLEREIEHAWPMLVLAMRAAHDAVGSGARFVLHSAKVAEAAPFYLSMIRRPHRWGIGWEEENAEAFLSVAKPSREFVDEFVGYLGAADVQVRPEHAVLEERDGVSRLFHLDEAARRLLVPFADDERVFSAYLARYGELYPFSERALRRAKRMKDERVVPALRAQLAYQAREAEAFREGKHAQYREEFGVLARALAKLGDSNGCEALEMYRRHSAWLRKQPL
jgi:hypothetical protein